MTEPAKPQGMVDHLVGEGARTSAEFDLARALVRPGAPDPALIAFATDPDMIPARQNRNSLRLASDWAQLGQYRQANADLAGRPVETVFLGDSITELWPFADPELFSAGVICRGISGQTSAQILLRALPDAVALRPRSVHLMCGVNDIAGNTGPNTPMDYRNNITAIATVIQDAGIRLIIGSLTPAATFAWSPHLPDPRARIRELNAWLEAFASARSAVFADYHAVLRDADDAMTAGLSRDGLHPLIPGYELMRPVAHAALASVA